LRLKLLTKRNHILLCFKTIQKSIDVDLHYSIFNDRFCETPEHRPQKLWK